MILTLTTTYQHSRTDLQLGCSFILSISCYDVPMRCDLDILSVEVAPPPMPRLDHFQKYVTLNMDHAELSPGFMPGLVSASLSLPVLRRPGSIRRKEMRVKVSGGRLLGTICNLTSLFPQTLPDLLNVSRTLGFDFVISSICYFCFDFQTLRIIYSPASIHREMLLNLTTPVVFP